MSKLQQKPILHGRDHRPGGVDPIPGIEGGIQYGVENNGNWLEVLTNGPGTDGPGFGLDFQDYSGGGMQFYSDIGGSSITLDQFGDTSSGVLINNGQAKFADGDALISGGTVTIHGAPTIDIHTTQLFGDSPHQTITLQVAGGPTSSGCNIVIESTDNTITFAFGGGTAILYPSPGTNGVIFEMQDRLTNPILRVDTGDPTFPFAPEYHIATGASWVADL